MNVSRFKLTTSSPSAAFGPLASRTPTDPLVLTILGGSSSCIRWMPLQLIEMAALNNRVIEPGGAYDYSAREYLTLVIQEEAQTMLKDYHLTLVTMYIHLSNSSWLDTRICLSQLPGHTHFWDRVENSSIGHKQERTKININKSVN